MSEDSVVLTGKESNSKGLGLDVVTMRWWRVFFLLLLCTLAAWKFELEGQLRLPEMMVLSSGLFLGLGLVPTKWRSWLVLVASLGGLFWFFGPVLGASIALLGALMVGVVQSSLSHRVKVVTSVVFFLILIAWRTGLFGEWADPRVAMIIGIFFMFKLVVFLYDQRKSNLKMSNEQAWNYFFMLPNYILFIFPIVDSKVFKQSHLEGDRYLIYEKGVLWLLRGLYLLLIYRFLYYYVIPAPGDVRTWAMMVVYHVVNYLLVVRLIGFFFISTGILCLLGYNLPKVFDNMFLANSFSDLWRRLNIYWKDYLMKLFYFPLYFKVRKSWTQPVFKIVLIVFVVNWAMHGYQWFWILGNFPIRDTDMLFWGVFGVLVALNSIYELGKNKSKGPEGQSEWVRAARHALQIMMMFTFMTILWTFWTSPSVEYWTGAFGRLISFRIRDLWLIGGVIGAALFGLTFCIVFARRRRIVDRTSLLSWNRQLAIFPLFLILANVSALKPIMNSLSDHLGVDLSGMYEERLNKADEEQIFEGYYEELILGSNINSRVLDANLRADGEREGDVEWVKLNKTGILRYKKGLWDRYLLANQEIEFKGEPMTTNEYGLRDRSGVYSKEREDSTFRIALLGGSIEMGSGVSDEEIFENLLENRLNAFFSTQKIEVINFAISGIHMPQHIGILQEKVREFSPDVVFYFAHTNEIFRALKSFAKLMRDESVGEYEELERIRLELGIDGNTYMEDRNHAASLIESKGKELYDWGLRAIHNECEDMGYHCVWVYLQSLGYQNEREFGELKAQVDQYGFEIFNLADVFLGHTREDLSISPWDRHPNDKGHQLIADELFRLITSDPDWKKRIENHIRPR